jgi:O-antigen ligase
LLFGIGAAPVVFVPAANDIFGLPKLALVTVVVAVAAVATAWGGGFGGFAWPAATCFVAVFAGVVAAATAFSISPVTSLFGGYERYGGLVPMLVYVAFGALVVVHWWREPDRFLREVPLAVLAGGLVCALYIVVQVAGLDVVAWEEKSGAAVRYQAGTLGNSNFAAGYLGATLPLFWPVFASATRRRVRVAIAAAAAIYAFALVATQGRGGLLAALVGLVLLLTAAGPRDRRAWAVKTVMGAVAALLVVGGVLAVRLDVFRTESLDIRRREWAAGLSMFADRPALGSGPDTYALLYPQKRTVADGRALGLEIADKPHNLFIEYAATTGVLGLAAFVALLVAVGRAGWRRRREAAALLAVGAAYLAQAFFSFEVPPLALLFWVVVAGLIVVADPALVGRRQPVKGKAKRAAVRAGVGLAPKVVAAAVAAAVAVALVVASATALLADLAARDHPHHAARLVPWQPAYAMGEGAFLERRGAESGNVNDRRRLLEGAVTAYHRALGLEPRSLLAVLGLARTYGLIGGGVDPGAFVEADRWWAEASRLDPHDWVVHEGYGYMLNSWANAGAQDKRSLAADELRLALRIKPDRVPTLVTLARVQAALGDRAGARATATRALALDPGNADAQALAAST